MTDDPSEADPRDPAFFHDPFATYRTMHASPPTFRWEAYGHLCFAAHADVASLLRDRRFGRQSWRDHPPSARDGLEHFDAVERHSMLELEPPRHTGLRRAVNRSFVSRHIEPLGTFVARRANALVEAMPRGEPFDLLRAYATPIPVETIATLLGVPLEHTDRLLEWSHAMVAIYAFRNDEQVRAKADAAARQFSNFVRERLLEAKSGKEGTLLERLATDPELSTDEAISTTILLLNAGHEATVHQIGNAVRLLIERRDAGFDLHAWLADERVDGLVEECLRYAPPLHLFTRTAYGNLDWTDADGAVHHVADGETVGLLLGAANRDPRRFTEPDRFDPGRGRIDHVSFGGGIHFCVGAPLARMELRIALQTLFRRHPNLRLTAEPVVADTFHFHGLERLTVIAD